MATNKRITDLSDFTSVLPYASEVFGIYQPLLGWKSKRMIRRFNKGLFNDKNALLSVLKNQFSGQVQIEPGDNCQLRINLQPGLLNVGKIKPSDSVLLTAIAEKLPPYKEYNDSIWPEILSDNRYDEIFKQSLIPHYAQFFEENCKKLQAESRVEAANSSRRIGELDKKALLVSALEKQLKYESALAGSLKLLLENKNYADLKNIFYSAINNHENAINIIKALSSDTIENAYLDIENLNPRDKDEIQRVALSPISVVHLFRQYFFELDTFLGTPVGHVWLSPGSSVELIEVSTKKTIVEKTLETTLETITKTEKDITEQDEISDAVKEDNKQDIKFGASVSGTYMGITASSNFDLSNSQQKAREQTHKRMRQQTEKLSTEIRKNVKSTFKTVTEITDTSSKRYVLGNSTGELMNYEMRRKMRQVGVQVQDIGTYLCWQTYVDDPGKDLGIAKLIHMAKPPELGGIPEPEKIPYPPDEETTHPYTIPFISPDGADKNEAFKNGHEVNKETGEDEGDRVKHEFDVSDIYPPKTEYELVEIIPDTLGENVQIRILDTPSRDSTTTPYKFKINLDYVNFSGKDSLNVAFKAKWRPTGSLITQIEDKNKANVEKYNADVRAAAEKAFIDSAKDRVKLASKIQQRKSEDLREEERIVVYRRLIQDMLSNGISMPDDKTRHIVAELINSIFDVDKMLYFVAPEWWRPRLHHSHQELSKLGDIPKKGVAPGSNALQTIVNTNVTAQMSALTAMVTGGDIPQLKSSTVGWGGVKENNRDNYYITEDSEPAKLGSSLGWLLQLDGDNLRNAFLNAPWVKAVIPIRPGKEEAAINWLKGVEGFNGIGDNDIYRSNNPEEKDINGNPLDGQKLIDVLMDLAKKIQQKHEDGIKNGVYPKKEDIANPELVDAGNVVTSTPIDRVYEHGFYALKDGFRANVDGHYQIFDQWIEILPTDQIVPVEVKYDPKTGRQIS